MPIIDFINPPPIHAFDMRAKHLQNYRRVYKVAAGALAHALRDRLEGLDLNPVIVGPQGACAVDALVTLRPA